jgi:subfamily B ATP-binding cassette protein MsbA
MIIYGATDGAVPYLLKRVLDDVFGSQKEGMLYLLVTVIVVFALIRGVFGFVQKYLSAIIGLGIVRDIRNEINNKILRLSPATLQSHTTGNLISRVTNDTLQVRTALTDAVAAFLRDSVRVIALLCVSFYLDPVLAIIAFVGLPIGIFPVIRFGKKVRKLSRLGQNHFGGLTSLLQETITGHRVVQSFTQEDYEQERFTKENEKFTEAFRRAEKYGALSGPTNEVVASIAMAAIITYGGLSVISGVRTQGDFIAFITALFLLYEPVKKLSRLNSVLQTGVAAAERIFEILDAPIEIEDKPDARDLEAGAFDIEYRDLSFSYDLSVPEPEWALRNVSLKVDAGQTLALVGMSGGGKSTLANLIPRFFDASEGAVLINGCDVRDYTLQSLRRSVAVVGQHTFLFNDTLFHNIAYGSPDATLERVQEAARSANAHEFIEELPQGYDTVIGEQGLKLSGGQRARIAIARALVKDAPILVLDEATASLDSESEGLVQQAIDKLMIGRTVVVVAHRLATVRKAEKIAVIVNGQVVEVGGHEQLLQNSGEYAKLCRLQFDGSSNIALDAPMRATLGD